jgi:hypothetical protein
MLRTSILAGTAAISLLATSQAHAVDYSYTLSDAEQQQVRQCFDASNGDAFADCIIGIGKQSLHDAGPQVIALVERATEACTFRNTGLDAACAKDEGPAIADAVMVALRNYALAVAQQPAPDTSFSFSLYCSLPATAHLCALLASPASDNE